MLKNYKKKLMRLGAAAMTIAVAATSLVAVPTITAGAFASPVERSMENLNRGVVAVPVNKAYGTGNLVMWRRLGTEPADTVFTLYKNKEQIFEGAATNFVDPTGNSGDFYTVVANGKMSEPFQALAHNYIEIPMTDTPDCDTMAMDRNGIYYSCYAPGDGSYGDLDGDGEYEIVILWNPPDAKDAASTGRTGKVYMDAYKLDGTFMWQIDMGYNIRAGAHDTMLTIADFDSDGRAEVMVRTADGTIDGKGNMIGDAEKGTTYEGSWAAMNAGKNLQGPLYVSVFDGETGAVLDTMDYYPQNTIGSMETCYSFGDDFGNRCERYNATIAWLDPAYPSVVFARGYYFGKNGRQRQAAAAYEFRNGKLNMRWAFDTEPGQAGYKSGNEVYVGQGNHQIEAADVDGDGKDEITTGALWYDDDGSIYWSSQLEHGDVVHVGDFDPMNEGLEMLTAKEDYAEGGENFKYSNPILSAMGIADAIGADPVKGEQSWGILLQDAKTGKMLQVRNGTKDTGRGMIGNIGYDDSYYVMWGAGGTGYHDNTGKEITDLSLSMNGRIYWDGDLQDELQDHRGVADSIVISKWNNTTRKNEDLFVPENSHSVNSTKGNHSGQGDMIGDWREEFVSYAILEEHESVTEIEVPANWDKTITAQVTKPERTYALRFYITDIPTDYNFYTLAHDDVYRNSSGTYNNCYNQPPHISWYMNDHLENSPYTTQPESRVKLVANKYSAPAFDAGRLPDATTPRVEATAPGTGDTEGDGTNDGSENTPAVTLPAGEFTDTVNHWAKDSIKQMGVLGYIDGMGDGTFRPDGTVTKGQFIKMVIAAMDLPVGSSSGHWSQAYVNTATAANILSKNINVSSAAALDEPISREEMASVVARAVEYKNGEAKSATSSFTDADSISAWAAADVSAASSMAIVTGFEDGSFRPNDDATRAQAATMLARLVNIIKK